MFQERLASFYYIIICYVEVPSIPRVSNIPILTGKIKKLDKKELSKSGVSISELVSAMRSNGVPSMDKINYAVQEPDGNISIIPYKEMPQVLPAALPFSTIDISEPICVKCRKD